jgi:hypothetical protein
MVPPSGWKKALTETMLTTAPPPLCFTIWVTAARVARNAEKKFICMAHSNSSSLVARKPASRRRTAPMLLTSTSTRPCSAMARSTSCRGPSAVARSTATALTPGRWVRLSMVRAPATTWAPSAARARVTASPMPLLAAVTTAIFPFRSRSMFFLRSREDTGGAPTGPRGTRLRAPPAQSLSATWRPIRAG